MLEKIYKKNKNTEGENSSFGSLRFWNRLAQVNREPLLLSVSGEGHLGKETNEV